MTSKKDKVLYYLERNDILPDNEKLLLLAARQLGTVIAPAAAAVLPGNELKGVTLNQWFVFWIAKPIEKQDRGRHLVGAVYAIFDRC